LKFQPRVSVNALRNTVPTNAFVLPNLLQSPYGARRRVGEFFVFYLTALGIRPRFQPFFLSVYVYMISPSYAKLQWGNNDRRRHLMEFKSYLTHAKMYDTSSFELDLI